MAIDTLEFGVCLAYYFDLQETGEIARRVEELGFDSLWVTENVHSRTPSLEPLLERYTYPVTHLRLGANCILGTVDDCVRLLKEYQGAGTAHIVLDPTCPKENVLPLLEKVSREILPHFK